MLELNQNVGVSGEFQVIVRRADGSVRIDTGMQKNLILDNGLRYYLNQKLINDKGEEHDHMGSMLSGVVVGSGNQEPRNTEVSLQSFVAASSIFRDTKWGKAEPTEDQHPNFVKVWKQTKFILDGIHNQNISELGLVTFYGETYISSKSRNEIRYTLVTRALIKGIDGRPITITVLEGEVLEIIYQINMYVDIRRQTGEFKLTTYPTGQNPDTGVGTESQFEYFLQPYDIHTGQYIDHNFFMYDSYYSSVHSYGVKESDDELTSDYDLNQAGYQFNHKEFDWVAFNKLIDGDTYSRYDTNKYSDHYKVSKLVSTDLLTGKQTTKHINGMYTHIYRNGIRGIWFGLGLRDVYTIVQGVVVLKNKSNGQGIKKTNRQIWEFLVSYTIKRWEG